MLHLLKKSILLVLLGFLLVTCKKENLCDCFKGTGKETTETRKLATFDKVIVQDKITVHLIEGSEYSVKIEAGKQVLKLIKTTIENGTLTITDDNKCDFTRSYKRKVVVQVTMPTIRKITNDGVGDVYMDSQFTCDTLNYYMSNSGNMHLNLNANIVYGGMHGNGDVYMKGTVNENFLHASGQGFYDGFKTVSNGMFLTLKTSGGVNVNAVSKLKIDMYARSSGNVYYIGHPVFENNIVGNGKIIDAN